MIHSEKCGCGENRGHAGWLECEFPFKESTSKPEMGLADALARVEELEKERERLLEALRDRCVCDSKGFYDYDVAEWLDPKPEAPHEAK